jgi:hypothetical protein
MKCGCHSIPLVVKPIFERNLCFEAIDDRRKAGNKWIGLMKC